MDPPSASEGASRAASTPISELRLPAVRQRVPFTRLGCGASLGGHRMRYGAHSKEELCAAHANEFENPQPLRKQRVTCP